MTDTLTDRRARTRDQLLVAAQTLLMDQTAGSLGIRQITTAAGMVHGSFYNYYPSVDALIDDLSALIFASHASVVLRLREGLDDPVAIFARVTRQTLHMVVAAPDYGRLLFDTGAPIDRFVAGLRMAMRADVIEGVRLGRLATPSVEVAVSLTAGAILGAAMDLHRGRLPVSAIGGITAQLLEMLGAAPEEARRLAGEPLDFVTPPPPPLRWQAVPAPLREALHVA